MGPNLYVSLPEQHLWLSHTTTADAVRSRLGRLLVSTCSCNIVVVTDNHIWEKTWIVCCLKSARCVGMRSVSIQQQQQHYHQHQQQQQLQTHRLRPIAPLVDDMASDCGHADGRVAALNVKDDAAPWQLAEAQHGLKVVKVPTVCMAGQAVSCTLASSIVGLLGRWVLSRPPATSSLCTLSRPLLRA